MNLLQTRFQNLVDISGIDRIKFRNDINGLRAVSVVSVILYHIDSNFFKGGYLGVDIFFVISGYLISNIIFSEIKNDEFTLKKFYIRRIRRILPAVFSTIIFSFPFAYFLLSPSETIEYLNSILYTLFFVSNIYFSKLDFYNSEPTDFMPFLHTWSLGVEEQFYIIFPILLLLIYKYFQKQIFKILISIFLISIYLNLQISFENFYLIQYRFWQLLAGVIICILSNTLRIKFFEIPGLFIIFYTINNFGDDYILSLRPRILVTVGVACILFSENESSLFEKASKNQIVKNLGLTSFSLYLLHQPIFAFARIYHNKNSLLLGNLNDPNFFYKKLFEESLPWYFLLLFVLANINFHYVESKFLKITTKLKYIFYLLIFILLIIFLGLSDDGFKYRYENISPELLEYRDNRVNSLIINEESCWQRNIREICYFNRQSDIKIYNFGDSHSHTLSPYLVSTPILNTYDFIDLSGCVKYIEHLNTAEECKVRGQDIDQKNEYLKNIKNSYVIYFINTKMEINKYNVENFEEYINTTFTSLLRNNNKLIIVYPVPQFNFGIPQQFIEKGLDVKETVSINYSNFLNDTYMIASYKIYDNIQNTNIFRVYPEKIFCDSFVSNECVGAFSGKLFYYDKSHLTKDGAALVGREIEKIINN